MVERVKQWLADGHDVRIFTARVWPLGTDQENFSEPRTQEALAARRAIVSWCQEVFNQLLPVTCMKDYGMIELWDDRAVQVKLNTGEPIGFSTRGL
jgi:hypothetical protein